MKEGDKDIDRMDCEYIRSLIDEGANTDTLNDIEQHIGEHIKKCPVCREHLKKTRNLLAIIKEAKIKSPRADFISDLSTSILKRIHSIKETNFGELIEKSPIKVKEEKEVKKDIEVIEPKGIEEKTEKLVIKVKELQPSKVKKMGWLKWAVPLAACIITISIIITLNKSWKAEKEEGLIAMEEKETGVVDMTATPKKEEPELIEEKYEKGGEIEATAMREKEVVEGRTITSPAVTRRFKVISDEVSSESEPGVLAGHEFEAKREVSVSETTKPAREMIAVETGIEVEMKNPDPLIPINLGMLDPQVASDILTEVAENIGEEEKDIGISYFTRSKEDGDYVLVIGGGITESELSDIEYAIIKEMTKEAGGYRYIKAIEEEEAEDLFGGI